MLYVTQLVRLICFRTLITFTLQGFGSFEEGKTKVLI
jgi:hypothetical protein